MNDHPPTDTDPMHPAAARPSSTPAGPSAARASTSPLFGILVGLAILAAGIGGYALGRHRSGLDGEAATATGTPRPAAERDASPPVGTLERQTAMHLLSSWRIEPADLLAPVQTAVGGFEAVMRPPPPYDAVDATLIDALDVRIRLAQAKPVGNQEICIDRTGQRFTCGIKGRAVLQNHLRGKTLVCRRLFLGGVEQRGFVDASCSVAGEDLALRQIRAGYAFPNEYADADQRAALEEARRTQAGVWAGPYEIAARDASLTDAHAIAFGSLRIPIPAAITFPEAEGTATDSAPAAGREN